MRVTALLSIAVGCLPLQALAQTRVDLRSQSKNIDFSQAQSVRPFRTGTVLPPVCTAGEMFFKTDAAPGSNMFGCVATDTWGLEGETDPVTDVEAELDVTGNRLTIGCRRGNCNVQTGDVITTFSNLNASFVPASGTYTAYVYFEEQTLRYGYAEGTMSSCATSCVAGITGFPANAVPLFTAAVWNGKLQGGSLTDRRSRYRSPKRSIAGANIVVTETADAVTYSLVPGLLRNQPLGTPPACTAETRGILWHANGAAGAKDEVTVCAKDASDAYAWRNIY